MFAHSNNEGSNAPRTPTRDHSSRHTIVTTPHRTSATTPHRTLATTPHRTPHRLTPHRTPTRSAVPRQLFKTPIRTPDFTAIAKQDIVSSPHTSFFAYSPEKEPIKAYLRIRPHPSHLELESREPYLNIVNGLEISMTPPADSNAYRTRNRAPERYRFSKIFTESVTQEDFFNKTTLPLIEDLLKGVNALIFAYGVTNSGKTYSIMGTQRELGILPRTLEVIFKSIDGYISDSKLKPCMHSLVQSYDHPNDDNRDVLEDIHLHGSINNTFKWNTDDNIPKLPIDENYEYGIWVSFAEIYTEKIYDLLVRPDKLSNRKPLSLKYEYSSGHKYIAGLKEVRVGSIEETYAILLEGQKNRAEYYTITNHTSSRSHSIFTIRIVRVPIDKEYIIEDPMYATVSKLSIVDLAGSERYRNTLNSGQRLKEAGNINRSLMVLGQCMETLRTNQMKAEFGKKQAIVPFRHSKLTELFKSSFEGDGKTVMIVNVNPFDTGFDENSHVMKFAAVAKDVATFRRVHPKLEIKDIPQFARKRLRTISRVKKDEEGEMEEEVEEEEEIEDPFVDNLIKQLDDLRDKWIEAETRCATMESEIRQQVAKETETELNKMEEIYMSLIRRQNDVTEKEINERVSMDDSSNDFLSRLNDRQQILTKEMNTLRDRINDQETTKYSLLEKITQLEKDKQKYQENIKHLLNKIKNNEIAMGTNLQSTPSIEGSSFPTEIQRDESAMEVDDSSTRPEGLFEQFHQLRKRLRRSLFRGDEYSHDADIIMTEIEHFDQVTFDLVKESGMGKLMKMISEKQFQNDVYNIQHRAIALLKDYARLSLPVLAPHKSFKARDSIVVLSVSAGREEELIADMRSALDNLQNENMKLKRELKVRLIPLFPTVPSLFLTSTIDQARRISSIEGGISKDIQ
ncbi:kinesin motor domain-containing protein [Pilobolus umbonatus]|nr:kinesin motor domain-containing protein [Pilobolus umbonatus]